MWVVVVVYKVYAISVLFAREIVGVSESRIIEEGSTHTYTCERGNLNVFKIKVEIWEENKVKPNIFRLSM